MIAGASQASQANGQLGVAQSGGGLLQTTSGHRRARQGRSPRDVDLGLVTAGCRAHPALRDFGACCSERVDELRREKPQSIYPNGGIYNKRQPARVEAGMAAMCCQRRGNRVTNRAQYALAALDLIEQGRDRVAVSQVSADMSDRVGHREA
jgi:hypothetical protein